MRVILGLYWGYIGVILGLYWGYIGVILGVILSMSPESLGNLIASDMEDVLKMCWHQPDARSVSLTPKPYSLWDSVL